MEFIAEKTDPKLLRKLNRAAKKETERLRIKRAVERAPKSEWFPGNREPDLVGYYEVRNDPPVHHNSRHLLVGRPMRYWNGKRWMKGAPGNFGQHEVSIFGTHHTHEWRGLAAPLEAA